MNTSMDYMNKFIENLPSPPTLEEYRIYLLLRARELVLEATDDKKQILYKKSAEYTKRAKALDHEVKKDMEYRLGIYQEPPNLNKEGLL